jgi:thioredoxin-related protein/tetratricopeptide (TPR) repeat protein
MLVRRFLFAGTAFVLVGLGALAGLARAEEGPWQTDFEAAKAKAKAEKKLLLVDFTGSDWCGWCKRLVAEVFGKEEFKKEAPAKFVLVEVDFPNAKKQSDGLKKQNKELQKRYKVRGYPTIFVMDADGKVIAQTGYRPGGPNAYMKHLGEFLDTYETVLKMRKELGASQGLDRAKLLDKLIDAYGKLNNESDELTAWDKEIVALDADNKAGLKVKHEFRMLAAEIEALKDARKFNEMKAVAEKALALPGVSAEQKQGVYMGLCECYFNQGDFVSLVASLKKGIEVAPDSDQAKQFKMILERFKPMADAQEAVAKLKAKLEGTQGLDRAKLLDKLVEAQAKIPSMGQPTSRDDVEKWSREIIALDPDNKAGLKKKYEIRSLLGDAERLYREKKKTEAYAAVEKALATPGITPDQTQEAHFVAAMLQLRAKDYDKGLASLKASLKAAPNSERAESIKGMIERVESQLGADKK